MPVRTFTVVIEFPDSASADQALDFVHNAIDTAAGGYPDYNYLSQARLLTVSVEAEPMIDPNQGSLLL